MALRESSAGTSNLERHESNDMSMIVVVGVTGSGKSYFINRLAGKEIVEEGGKLNSCTQKCQMIPLIIGNTKTLLIDTPGFDDTQRPDAEILNEIANVLAAQYALGFSLKGVVYVHRITDIRFSGSNVKTLEIMKRVCGEKALKNVLLVTSRWNEVEEETGADREHQLRDEFWAYMLAHGSCVSRFHGDRPSAISLVSQLLMKDSVVLRLQHEIIDEGKKLNMTSAGAFVENSLEEAREEYSKEIRNLQRLREELQENDRAMRRRWEADWAKEQAKLRSVEEQQDSLRRYVAEEVQKKIEEETKSNTDALAGAELSRQISPEGILGEWVLAPSIPSS
ncbi:hypothetical protein CKAH01_15007 [Colletotrichum kahawae]|uniref:AIG1-type G domain-containing protein n=1 Tax=Colletotrichum kahawae TaxID=34407 RepID=A0AAD9YJD4_COLKA|nr:hypothetical protein CKAH01_15007 [Colletotrichum kahawae]